MTQFSILTLNLWNLNEPFLIRMERIVAFLNIKRPDVICLQEVSPYGSSWQSDYVASQCGYASTYFSYSGNWKGRDEGLAILSHAPIASAETISLPSDPEDMPRLLQIAIFQFFGVEILIGNTHLAFHVNAGRLRRRQATVLASSLRERLSQGKHNVILCGDFNDTPGSDAVSSLLADETLGLKDVWTTTRGLDEGLTFSSNNSWVSMDLWPNRRIDYIFTRALVPTLCNLVFTDGSEEGIASDHFGVMAYFNV